MKKVFLLMSLLPVALHAQTISTEDAQNKALQFLQGQSQTRASQREVQLKLAYTSKSGDETYYYVFNNADGGYVIMGGDEAAKEVLGYGETGSFDYARIPDNMRWWLSQYDAQISQAIREVKAGINSVARQAQTRAERAEIPVMLTTKWGQNEPYNCQIPTYAAGYTGKNALVTGCVITAAAQVMKYYEWPDVAVGSATMSKKYHDLQFEADFDHTHYDWEHMSDTYTPFTYTGSKEEIAVGTLMYHLGVATNADYNIDATSAYDEILMARLVDTFKYNKGMTYKSRKYYSNEEWEQLIYNELSEGRPVLYVGYAKSDTGVGHAFVCDGYEDGLWHINWGWDGDYNSYFLLTSTDTEEALSPDGTGTGGAYDSDSYSLNQSVYIGLYPDKDGTSEYIKDTLVVNQILVRTDNTYQPGENVLAEVHVEKNNINGYPLQIKYKLVNTEDKEEILINPDIVTVGVKAGKYCSYNFYLTIPTEAKRGATYQLELLMEDEQGEWNPFATKPEYYRSSISISRWAAIGLGKSNHFTIYNDGYASADSKIGNVGVRNYSQERLTQPLVIWVYPEEGGDSIDYFDLGEVTLESNNGKTLDFSYQDLHSQTLPGKPQTLVPGQNYLLRLQNLATGEIQAEPIPLYFRESMTIECTIPETGWGTLCLPFNIVDLPEGLAAYFLGDVLNDEVSLYDESFIMPNFPYIIHCTPGTTYSFTGPATPVGLQTVYLLTSSTEGDIYAPKGSYVLQCRDGITGFYKVQEDNQVLVKQYEAYLVPDTECGDFISLGEYYQPPTAIECISAQSEPRNTQSFDLSGKVIGADHKGIVIRDGKVYIIK